MDSGKKKKKKEPLNSSLSGSPPEINLFTLNHSTLQS